MIRFFIILLVLFISACTPPPSPTFPLKNTYWSLVSLNSQPSTNAQGQALVHIIFHVNGNVVQGSDGCNSLRAEFNMQDETMTFQNISSSKIACAEGVPQAYKFIKALEVSDAYKINKNFLILYHNENEIARFEAKESF